MFEPASDDHLVAAFEIPLQLKSQRFEFPRKIKEPFSDLFLALLEHRFSNQNGVATMIRTDLA